MNMTLKSREAFVVIVGAGPSGATLALTLGLAGVPAILVDAGTSPLPGVRAGGGSARTMEIFRLLGAVKDIRARAPLPEGWPRTSVITTGLCRDVLAIRGPRGDEEPFATAERFQNVPSAISEGVLREHIARCESITPVYGVRCEGVVANEGERASVSVVDEHGERLMLTGSYIVACDGANSAIRESLHIPLGGHRHFSSRMTVEFEAPDLGKLHGLGHHNQYSVFNHDIIARILHQDAGRRWTMQVEELASRHQDKIRDPKALVELAVGAPVEIGAASVRRWRANAFYTDRLREGRIFLAGDAAHATPPGALGFHQGVGDSFNLGWKLAAVYQGWADEALLDTYQTERWAPGRALALEVDVRGPRLIRWWQQLDDEAYARAVLNEVELRDAIRMPVAMATHGCTYQSSTAIDGADGPSELAVFSDPRIAETGKQIPHALLPDGEALIDANRNCSFALFVSAALEADAGGFRQAAEALGIPLVIRTVPEPILAQISGRDPSSLALLTRPDSIVAWMGFPSSIDPSQLLTRLLGRAKVVA